MNRSDSHAVSCQVHLDFHTSELIEGIGAAFSKENFQQMLRLGHVDSITVFSKCHHGWAYHPSEANEMHPYLYLLTCSAHRLKPRMKSASKRRSTFRPALMKK